MACALCPGPNLRLATVALAVAVAIAGALALGGCNRAPDDAPFSGYAEAELVYVAPSTGGTLHELKVQRGDAVKAGQPLFTLDSDAETLARAGADARVQRAQAQAANLEKGRRPLELRALDEQLAQARAALALSTAQLDRQRTLVAQGYVAALRLDKLQAALDRDAARLRELQAQRTLAQDAARADEVAAARADARGAAADADLARWRESQRGRAAPLDAQVYDVLYRPGEWVAPGAPVVALLPPQGLKLRLFVPQAQLATVAVGTRLKVACDGCPAGLTARVRWIAPQAEYTPPVIYSNASRSKLVFMVEAVPDDGPRAALKPGQPVDVTLPPRARTS